MGAVSVADGRLHPGGDDGWLQRSAGEGGGEHPTALRCDQDLSYAGRWRRQQQHDVRRYGQLCWWQKRLAGAATCAGARAPAARWMPRHRRASL